MKDRSFLLKFMNSDHKIFNQEITLIFRRWFFNLWSKFIPISIVALLAEKNISSLSDEIPSITGTGLMEVYQKWLRSKCLILREMSA